MLKEPVAGEAVASQVATLTQTELTQTEQALRDIWREVFANPAITADDDFYELDGYSLLAARIALRVREIFGVELPLDEIYQTPTVREVAAYIDRRMASTTKPVLDSTSLVLFKSGSVGLPLFFLHSWHGHSSHYLMLVQHLEIDRAMYGIDSPDLKSDQPLQRSLPEMAAFCITEMRKVQPQGPYFLIGYSWSGLLAFETAQQLRAAGQEVALLAVLDSAWRYNPSSLPPPRFLQRRFGIPVRRFMQRVLGYLPFHLRRIRAALQAKVEAAKSQTMPVPTEDDLLQAKKLEVVRQAMETYNPAPYDGRIAYFPGQLNLTQQMERYQRQVWTFLARGGIQIHTLPGTHEGMIIEPSVAATAEALAECIRKGSMPATLTPTEAALCNIWREVFANPAITADDDFYELDGYSLLAARIALRVREMFGVELPLEEIYQTPTVREVAAYIDRHMSIITRSVLDSASLVLFKAGSAGLPLFFPHAPHGRSSHYWGLAQRLEIDRPMYGIDSPNLKSDQPAQRSLPEMAAFCIAEMHKVQPQGPYFLIGYSWSGLLAFEMAQQLGAAGEEVALLAALDSAWWYNPTATPPLRFMQLHFGIHLRRFERRVLGYLMHKLRRIRSLLGSALGGEVAPAKSQNVPEKSQKILLPVEDDLLRSRKLALVRSATIKYRPVPYAGRIAYFPGQTGRIPLMGRYQRRAWSFLARGGIEVHELPGTHIGILTEPLLVATAEALTECIRQVSTPANGR